MRPLAGKRVVVTRSAAQSAEFCTLLADLGAIPIAFPVIDFVPLPPDELLRSLAQHRYDWLIFTSVNAVEFFFKAVPQAFQLAKIAAVGAATLAALEARGFSADFVPPTFSGEALANGLGDLTGQRVLLPRAKGGRPEIVSLLRENGAMVDDVDLYETVRVAVSAESVAALAGHDAVTFTSPSSVRNFMALAPEHCDYGATVVACIGPTTAAEARSFGLEVDVMPARYTIPDMISALVEFWN